MHRFPCPFCRKTLKAQDNWAGRDVACPNCGQRFIIPPPSQPPAAKNTCDLPLTGEPLVEQPPQNAPTPPPVGPPTAPPVTVPVADSVSRHPQHLLHPAMWAAIGGAIVAVIILIAILALPKRGDERNLVQGVPTRRTKIDSDLTTWTDQELLAAMAELRKPESIFRRAAPAVARVITHDRNGTEIATGSGFLVSKDGLVVTNYHVVEDASIVAVIFEDDGHSKRALIEGLISWDERADLAVMKMAGEPWTSPLSLGSDDLPGVATKVYAIGHPLGRSLTYSEGPVSAHTEVRGMRMIQTTAAISQGSSGGPLLGLDGEVVGVTTGTFVGGQNLNIAVPVSHVRKLLQVSTQRLTRLPLPGASKAYAKRARLLREKKDYDGAIEAYTEAIRIDPSNSAAFFGRGYAWDLKKDLDRAIADYDEAIRVGPPEAIYYSFRGHAWRKKKNYDRAIQDFGEAIRLDPSDPDFLSSRALAWSAKGEFDRSISDYDAAIRLAPTDSDLFCSRGHVWFGRMYWDRALRDYDEAIRLAPQGRGLLLLLPRRHLDGETQLRPSHRGLR